MRRCGFLLVGAVAILISGVVGLAQAGVIQQRSSAAVQQTVAAASNSPKPMLLWPAARLVRWAMRMRTNRR